MKWILTQEKLPDKECENVFCTLKRGYYTVISSIESYYPQKKVLYQDRNYFVQGQNFGSVYAEDGEIYFRTTYPIAWAYVPDYESSDWIKTKDRLPEEAMFNICLLRRIDNNLHFCCGSWIPKKTGSIWYNFVIWNSEKCENERVDNVVAWMKVPEPFRYTKPTSEELGISFWNWKEKKPEHFTSDVEGSRIPEFFANLEEYAKEIPVSKNIYVYELPPSKKCYRSYEVEVVDKTADPKIYIDGRTDFVIKGRKLIKGRFLDERTFDDVFFGRTAIVNGVIYPRKEVSIFYTKDQIDTEIAKWLKPDDLKRYNTREIR